ncbi:hypothetical protein [Dactylosporangium sp. NPDC005555]|uniref:hypothetical protein n=1 Tax=Dactylosporangium sp. NPDC005555 TaxID=3154889 RepID=UPI0033AE39DF
MLTLTPPAAVATRPAEPTPYPDLADVMTTRALALLADDTVRPSIRERLAALLLTQAAALREGLPA